MASIEIPIRCYECGHRLKDTDRECPLCGAEVKFKGDRRASERRGDNSATSPFTQTIAWAIAWPAIIGAIVAGALIAGAFGNFGNMNTGSEAETRRAAEAVRLTDSVQRQRDAEAVTRAVAAGAGAKTFAEACTHCHTKDHLPLDKLQLTKEQWKEAIGHTVKFRPDVPRAKVPDLVEHLAGMNSAPAGPAKP